MGQKCSYIGHIPFRQPQYQLCHQRNDMASITLIFGRNMRISPETVRLKSLGDDLVGILYHPAMDRPAPVIIVCHGAGEFKENYFELCEKLNARGVAALAIDMHGHGASGGERFCVRIHEWVADVQAAIAFLATHPKFGLSSGGTAILEVAARDPRLKALVTLDATVRNALRLPMMLFLKLLIFFGGIKKRFTHQEWRLPLAKMGGLHLASDPEINRDITTNTKALAAFMAFPFPGGAEAFFVDTIKRVWRITAPTLVLWGEDDKLDPPDTGRLLHAALTCKKALHIIPGNGHVGHLDRHKEKVFALTTDWVSQNLPEALAAGGDVAGGLQNGNQNNRGRSSPESRVE
jgi:alpha-beta hydrolase superfamily lysophospholipase